MKSKDTKSTEPLVLDDSQNNDLDQLTYEQARDQLLNIVHQLETGNAPLSDSMELWRAGERLGKICQDWLAGAKREVSKVVESSAAQTPDGNENSA